MIGFVKGQIAAISEDSVVIDTGHIGYEVKVSPGTLCLLPGIGQEIKLHTYTHVREDLLQLYGFLTGNDLEIFKQLITVSGIGPKGGLAVLSVMSADDLRFAILSGDAKAIAKAPGIGAKTAERIIIDLRDKAALPASGAAARDIAGLGSSPALDSSAKNEAIEALVALGYGATEAHKAVRNVTDGTAEEMLKAALRNLM
ncbi:MAG: Holliday junction branch migration protein RuvA [Lachnospiraceae bacterium]|nr:Holliday junction branch migration protein RuvA [Lachnospiraceae bacterium]